MAIAGVAIRDGQLKALMPLRCSGCSRLLLRIDPSALKPHKALEVKCKCDTMNYLIGDST